MNGKDLFVLINNDFRDSLHEVNQQLFLLLPKDLVQFLNLYTPIPWLYQFDEKTGTFPNNPDKNLCIGFLMQNDRYHEFVDLWGLNEILHTLENNLWSIFQKYGIIKIGSSIWPDSGVFIHSTDGHVFTTNWENLDVSDEWTLLANNFDDYIASLNILPESQTEGRIPV